MERLSKCWDKAVILVNWKDERNFLFSTKKVEDTFQSHPSSSVCSIATSNHSAFNRSRDFVAIDQKKSLCRIGRFGNGKLLHSTVKENSSAVHHVKSSKSIVFELLIQTNGFSVDVGNTEASDHFRFNL
jgi:hypothetical protein